MINNTIENITAVSFLDKLRSETSLLHKKLESLPISKAIISEEVTTDNYGKYLDLMQDVVRDIESRIYPIISDIISDSEKRTKLQSIKNDLEVLKFEYEHSITDFDGEFTIPFSMGIMYVLEGSTLGGRVILKNIEKNLGYNAGSGAQYFAGYKEETGFYWKNFLADLLLFESNTNSSDEIISGANFAFTTIYNHFSKNK